LKNSKGAEEEKEEEEEEDEEEDEEEEEVEGTKQDRIVEELTSIQSVFSCKDFQRIAIYLGQRLGNRPFIREELQIEESKFIFSMRRRRCAFLLINIPKHRLRI
jgi:hypothetical protein